MAQNVATKVAQVMPTHDQIVNDRERLRGFILRNSVDDSREHLAGFMRMDSLKGLTFVDIGCGSGLHSLAAYQMGADRIFSFDYDPDSVGTTKKIHDYAGSPLNWTIEQGSVLDKSYMEKVPKSDIIYSWGVLHHTGDMWTAVRNAAIPMKPDGLFYIALYSSDNYVDPPPHIKLPHDLLWHIYPRKKFGQ